MLEARAMTRTATKVGIFARKNDRGFKSKAVVLIIRGVGTFFFKPYLQVAPDCKPFRVQFG